MIDAFLEAARIYNEPRYLAAAEKGGGFILAPAKAVQPGTPLENAVAALRDHGDERAVVAVVFLNVVDRLQQHAARAAGRVVDFFAWLGFEHLHHQMHHGAVGVKLLRGMSTVIGEFLDQELVTVAQLIFGHVGK